MKFSRELLVGAVVALVAFWASSSWAQSAGERWPELLVSGSCPEASAVQALLSTLVPRGSAPGPTPPPAVDVVDRETTFLVAVGSRRKIYADPTRDCAQRARIAAAFIALALLPDVEAPAPEPAPPRAAPPARPLVPAPRPPSARSWLSVDARGALALGLPADIAAPGVLVRAAAGRDVLGAHVTCGWFFGTSTQLAGESGSVLLERLPCAAGATAHWFWAGRHLETALDAGLAVGLLHVIGRGFAPSYSSSHAELGARIAADTALRFGTGPSALMPIVGLEVTAYATSYDLDVSPHGVVGRAPLVWGAVTAGVQWSTEFGP
jgi:hypothetical protein